MSLEQVQARATEIQARLRALQTGAAPRGTLGVAGPAADVFGAQLRAATGGAATPAASLTAATSATTTPQPLVPGARRSAASAASAGTRGEDVVATAKQQLGVDYEWGGESLAEGGFDCSGLVQWAYRQHGVELPRVAGDQARAGPRGQRRRGPPRRPRLLRATGPATRPHRPVRRERDLGRRAEDRRRRQGAGGRPRRRRPPSAASCPSRAPGPQRCAGPDELRHPGPRRRGPAGLPPAGRPYAGLIDEAAERAGVDPRLLASLAWSESGFDPGARSGAGATGLVQLMPATARGLGVTDTTDPAQSLRGGATYLRQQLDAFGGDPQLALAAYNAGPTAVRRHGGVPPYAETQKYVQTVLDRFRSLGGTP